MPDYDLSGLSSRSFEKLIQALAAKVLGPGTTTFGDGPDGGREATYEGKMGYPSTTNPWAGYCVVQAKFLQRPKGSRHDGQWALKQLEAELQAFADPKKRRRPPEYYIFATNVVLTPAQEQGGKDKAARLISRYRKRLPLQDWRIWDFDEIGKFLDSAEDIRRGYAAWITPGDVLSEVIQQLGTRRKDFLGLMTNYLAKELRSDQYANLEQAGHTAEERIPLARVFVDLPCTPQRSADPPEEDSAQDKITELVAILLERAKDSLDPLSTMDDGISRGDKISRQRGALPGRYVLVGGPGQGKTTVGQFACQLFRSALLQDRGRWLTQEVRDTTEAISAQCEPGKLELPKARRFPIRVILSDFASAVNEESSLSLLAYMTRQIAARTDKSVDPDDLRTWLSSYPWFIVLDGLDEVPPSTNREDVLRKIEEFWTDAAQVNSDILVLATTRPQGYSDDFSPAYYEHLWLAPLSSSRALSYARRLVKTRYAGEPDRQQKILSRLLKASQQEATARLMRSPLQVTIMATLVNQIGTPPQDRWRLFHDYYDVIYKREQERRIPAADLLRDHKANIDAIHHQIGLLLQVESERAGGTDAKLSADRFASVVTARLEEEGYATGSLDVLRDRIIEAAANRLVFLVGLEAGQVGFEIRSLQEYMAAEAVMSAPDLIVQQRLRRFAPIASWRNVFLFAAGRCFSQQQQQHLRDTINTICLELNDQLGGRAGSVTLAGSILAVELLEDGIARQQPRYVRLLAHSAVRLLELPPSEIHNRLADVCEGEAVEIIHGSLRQELSLGGPRSLAAWATLMALQSREMSWSRGLLDQYWPINPQHRLDIVNLPAARRAVDWVESHLEAAAYSNPPSRVRDFYWAPSIKSNRMSRLVDLFHMYHKNGYNTDLRVDIPEAGISVGMFSIDLAKRIAMRISVNEIETHPGWLPSIEDVRFSRAPSKKNLVKSLRRLAETWDAHSSRFYCPALSWVLSGCVRHCSSAEDMDLLAGHVAAGDLGGLTEWTAAEERWQNGQVSIDEWLEACGPLPFDSSIAKSGFPLVPYSLWTIEEFSLPIEALYRFDCAPAIQDRLASIFLFRRLGGDIARHKDLIRRLAGRQRFLAFSAIADLARLSRIDGEWVEVINEIGMSVEYMRVDSQNASDGQLIINLYKAHPSQRGLLPLVLIALRTEARSLLAELPSIVYEECPNPNISWATLVIELAQGGLKEDRAAELAGIAAKMLPGREWRLHELVQVLEHHERFDEVTEIFFIALETSLEEIDWREKAEVIGALNRSLRRRSSGVTRKGIWRSLQLPGELLPLVGEA